MLKDNTEKIKKITGMEIKCPKCFEIFNPNKEEEKKIKAAIQKEQKFFMTKCTKCYKSIPVNPCELLNKNVFSKDKVFYCPICKDWTISYIKDKTEKFYGCGEC